MISAPELRWQAERLLVEAENAGDIEKRILLELVSKLRQTASALERIEGYDSPNAPAAPRAPVDRVRG